MSPLRYAHLFCYGLIVVGVLSLFCGGCFARGVHGAATSITHSFEQTLGIGGAR